jgi:hypothetical protein
MITHENATAVSTVASGIRMLGGICDPENSFDHRRLQVEKLAATFRLPIATAGAVAHLAFGEVRP